MNQNVNQQDTSPDLDKKDIEISEQELNIYKFQFILNYMSQETVKDKTNFLKKKFELN